MNNIKEKSLYIRTSEKEKFNTKNESNNPGLTIREEHVDIRKKQMAKIIKRETYTTT